ncbi:PilN domain-containing protein [Solibacillus sp. CAU 1738]|uniref:PilN domain-containing protein n=1 Tax=Solibacillus sp. CAU 1738 TaxID=3140363 RepID=UPI003261BE4A
MIPDINLLPKLDKRETGSKLLYSLIGIATVMVLSLFVWQYFEAKNELATLTTEQQALQQQKEQLQSEYDVLVNASKGSLEESVAFVERVSYPVSPLMDETQNLLPKHAYLRNYSFAEKSTTISVDFETLNEISSYVNRLEQSAYFSDVQIGTVSNFDVNPNETSDGKAKDETFNEIPRYSVDITLFMDEVYLATGGVR